MPRGGVGYMYDEIVDIYIYMYIYFLFFLGGGRGGGRVVITRLNYFF